MSDKKRKIIIDSQNIHSQQEISLDEMVIEFVSADGLDVSNIPNMPNFALNNKRKKDIVAVSDEFDSRQDQNIQKQYSSKDTAKLATVDVPEFDDEVQTSCNCKLDQNCNFHSQNFIENTLQFQRETKKTLAKILDLLRSKPIEPSAVVKLDYVPITCAEEFEYLNEHILQDEEGKKKLENHLEHLKGGDSSNLSMNRVFQKIFTDDFLRLCKGPNFIQSEFMNVCFQEVWHRGEPASALFDFIGKVKYCLRLASNRWYKQNKDKTTQDLEDFEGLEMQLSGYEK